jgi:hypothetical protein
MSIFSAAKPAVPPTSDWLSGHVKGGFIAKTSQPGSESRTPTSSLQPQPARDPASPGRPGFKLASPLSPPRRCFTTPQQFSRGIVAVLDQQHSILSLSAPCSTAPDSSRSEPPIFASPLKQCGSRDCGPSDHARRGGEVGGPDPHRRCSATDGSAVALTIIAARTRPILPGLCLVGVFVDIC